MSVYEQIAALRAERDKCMAEYDERLSGLTLAAECELAEAERKVKAIQSALYGDDFVQKPKRPAPIPANPISETDAGNGIRETQDNMSAADFRDELAELRERTQAKRRRLG